MPPLSKRLATWLPSACVGASLAVILCGCASIGPTTVARDRFDYGSAITESWKRQTLLNVVKLRYLDPPMFVDVGQIVAGYQLETSISMGGSLYENDSLGGNSLSLGGAGRYTDRPTITYTPMTGNRFIAGLMTPFRPETVFSTIESGWPADAILFVALASLNGLKNQTTTVSGATPADPEFLKAIGLIRKIQASGAVAIRVVEGDGGRPTTIMSFNVGLPDEAVERDRTELRRVLRLDSRATDFRLVFGAAPAASNEIAVITRSMMQVMGTMASDVEVPLEQIAEGRASPGRESWPADDRPPPVLSIRSGAEEPADAYVAVYYRDRWFYIDDRDLRSKRSFAFLMLLFTMADTGEREGMPVITIPAQ